MINLLFECLKNFMFYVHIVCS